MDFLYGILTAIGIILFLVWGFFSVLGNQMNPASFVVGLLMDKRYNWVIILLVGLGALAIYYFKYLTK